MGVKGTTLSLPKSRNIILYDSIDKAQIDKNVRHGEILEVARGY